MAWPSQVTAGQAILASQFNAVVTAQQVWGGAASAGGYALTDLPSVGLHTTNASWQEFQFIANAGATQATDALFLQYNARTSSGGADSWNSVATVAVGGGAVTFYAGVAFNAAVAVNAQMTFNSGVNLNGQTLLGNAAFTGAITFASTVACYSSLGLRSANASWQEFQIVATAGGSQSADVLNLQWNARTSSGGSDSWSSFASVAVSNGTITFGGSVAFSNPANIAFGSGWQGPWTPTYSGSGSMTVTQATLAQALYLRIGPLVFFELYVVLNLGGSASSQITISLPVASVGNINSVSCSVLNGGSFVAACSWVNAGAASLNVQLSGQPNFNVSSQAYVLASGFYRCA